MIKFVFIICYVLYNFVWANRARIWTRIPKYHTISRVITFLNNNNIVDCFEHQETPSTLMLKCWRHNSLVNVRIDIDEETKKQRYFGISVSI